MGRIGGNGITYFGNAMFKDALANNRTYGAPPEEQEPEDYTDIGDDMSAVVEQVQPMAPINP
ncbi:MAG: hypothetical protein HUJ56_05970 [Erysipelotrichaceae bacterium]|nr:hypothetical protein [Erysipelotrichaceae bacterium]